MKILIDIEGTPKDGDLLSYDSASGSWRPITKAESTRGADKRIDSCEGAIKEAREELLEALASEKADIDRKIAKIERQINAVANAVAI